VAPILDEGFCFSRDRFARINGLGVGAEGWRLGLAVSRAMIDLTVSWPPRPNATRRLPGDEPSEVNPRSEAGAGPAEARVVVARSVTTASDNASDRGRANSGHGR